MRGNHLGSALRDFHRLFAEGTLAGLSDAELLERFLDGRDETAFGALVGRHGPMILATCRNQLDDPGEAEDAFQAVLMVLLRRAASLWVRGSLGGWLHEVACRVCLQANADAARRRTHE